jgi:hypothetical protein
MPWAEDQQYILNIKKKDGRDPRSEVKTGRRRKGVR